MCKNTTPNEPVDAPQAQTFANAAEFLAAIAPGMTLCTSDFTGWAKVERVEATGRGGTVIGRRTSDGHLVAVPAEALADLRGGHCVRIDRIRATIDSQGWELAPVNPSHA